MWGGGSGAERSGTVSAADRWKFVDDGKMRKVSNRLFTNPGSSGRYIQHTCCSERTENYRFEEMMKYHIAQLSLRQLACVPDSVEHGIGEGRVHH